MERTFVSLVSPTGARAGAGGRPCQGVWYGDGSPATAVIAAHYEVDFSEHYLAEPLASRGIGFLGWNTRFRGAGAYFLLEHALIDIGEGVRWLRARGIERLVLLGNSGGASLMGAYQSQARDPNITAAAGMRLPEAVLSLPTANLFVSLNAHAGRPDVLTAWMDPAVIDESDPLSVDPDLDMFDQRHGPPYAPEFVDRYRREQQARNERITGWTRKELERLDQAGVWDRLFDVHRVWADPRFLDLTIDPSDRVPGCYAGDPRRANYGPLGIARTSTLRTWLSMWSLETSSCRAEPHLARITEPSLVVQSTADQGCFPSDARAIFDAFGSRDKRLEFLPGSHYFEDTGPDAVADLIAAWIEAH